MYLFEVSSRHMTWPAQSQSVTAANIANADTPGYVAQAVVPFSRVLERTAMPLATTSPMHMSLDPVQSGLADRQQGLSWGSSHSGNNVSIERELMTASSNSRMMNLDSGIVKSFHRMILSSVKV